jgi:uroporphyrin-III C-methyltransferase
MPHETRLRTVRLVGAGPGPADLLTLRAARLIGAAQALLYDALVWPEVLALAPAACLKIQTGKRAGRASMRQETINRLMLRLARSGMDVVRLKGGDPSIFGRVGEEIEFLEAHGVSVEVTPGVTAACAAAAQFKFPLTHRGAARRVVFTTARVEGGQLAGDWRVAADPEATAAIYMGGAGAATIATRLIGAGRSAFTPVLTVENAGAPDARLCATTLQGLTRDGAAGSGGPLLIIVGDVAARAQAALPTIEEALVALRV